MSLAWPAFPAVMMKQRQGRPDDPGPLPKGKPATPERRSLPRLQPTGSSASPRKGEVRLAAPHHPTGEGETGKTD
ncbi:MAG: hypothetical protein EKK29_21875 [Hyphomicrobiales bacterium]|nr:MAG: hypothetical protein EKK29_21875 [Hyphomicrobiales bacterium]